MSKKIQLSIPKPCHEDWDVMTPVEKGRFCGSCQKQVVDFSNMSDRQVAEFFKKPSTGSVCGRFMTDQLQREIEIPKKRIPWLKYFFGIALPAFLVSLKASSARTQGKVKINENSVDTTKKPECLNHTMGIIARPMDYVIEEHNANGKIVDAETGKPLPNAVVTVEFAGGKENRPVKQNGIFVIDTSHSAAAKSIDFSCPGYLNKSITLKEFKKLSGENRAISLQKIEAKIMLGTVTANHNCNKPLMGDTTIINYVKGDISIIEPMRIISGKVVDTLGKPLADAIISVNDRPANLITNSSGEFSISVGDLNEITVKATHIGYETGSLIIGKDSRSTSLVIQLKPFEKFLVGELVVVSPPKNKQLKNVPLIPVIHEENQTILFKVFPNPQESGSALNIELKKAEEGYYSIQLLDLSGQSVKQQEVWIDAEAKVLNFDLPDVAAGSYFVVMTNKKSGKHYSEKVVIE